MVTWRLDRLLRSGPLCALATLVVPVLLAFIVSAVSDEQNVLSAMLIGAFVIGLGSVFGSVVMTGIGVALSGMAAGVAEIPTALLVVVGCLLFGTLIAHDLAGSLRRAPFVGRSIWVLAAKTFAGVAVASAAVFAMSYLVSTLAVWQSIVVPFGFAAIGFAIKLAADSHLANARQVATKE